MIPRLRPRASTAVVLIVLSLFGPLAAAQSKLTYPETRKDDVVETLFGVQIADPYRWLEDLDAADTAAWVEAQNKVTFGYLAEIPQREAIKQRMTKLWDYERYGTPSREGPRYIFSKNDGLQNQSVVYKVDTLDGAPQVLLNPNTLSADGTIALRGLSFTDDGSLLAYGLSDAGSDWMSIKVRDVATAQDKPDELKWVKFSGMSWTKDGAGFFYSRYDEPKDDNPLTALNKWQKVYYHVAGLPQDKDLLVYHRPDEPDWGFAAGVTEDGRYVVLSISQGTERKNRLYFSDLEADGVLGDQEPSEWEIEQIERRAQSLWAKVFSEKDQKSDAVQALLKEINGLRAERARLVAVQGGKAHGFVELLNDFDAEYDFVGNDGPVFYFRTDYQAPLGRVIAIDTKRPERENWKELIPQSKDTLVGVSMVNDQFIASYLKDAHTQVKIYDVQGAFVRDVELPGIGSAGGFGGKRKDQETFYSFTSYTVPGTVYRYDLTSGTSSVWKTPKVDFNPDDYETKQEFYASKDGTRIPIFIVHKKGLRLDGQNATVLYGYGGFNIPITPGFSVANLVWMEMGGVYAVANLRGGGEYGKEWHDAGRLKNKQNVFDDFHAAAEYLIQQKYTQPSKLAIYGGSNGGLLVGACMTQRPELYGAALPAVGVLDMLRFHKFTIGWAWTSDYGSPEDPEMFKVLHAYSPLHNLRPGTKYPATLITTGDHDDRVVPGHSFKFAAALQAAQAGDAPTLIRIETRAGHGAGKPTTKIIEEASDRWAFLSRVLDMQPASRPN